MLVNAEIPQVKTSDLYVSAVCSLVVSYSNLHLQLSLINPYLSISPVGMGLLCFCLSNSVKYELQYISIGPVRLDAVYCWEAHCQSTAVL